MAAKAEGRISRLPLFTQVAGFAIVGAMRTAIGYGAYVALLLVAPYWLAFSVSYVVVLAGSFILNGKFVFTADLTLRRGVRYGAIYCGNYLLSLGILTVAIKGLGIAAAMAPVVVIPIMFPVNFVTERYVLMR